MSNSDRMLDALRGKLAARGRSDIQLADFRVIDNVSASVLLEYDPEYGEVGVEDVGMAVARLFDGRVTAHFDTAERYPEVGAVKMMVGLVTATRRAEDADRMVTIVAGTRFMDQELQQVWQMEETPDGKFLRRVNEDDISKILAARRQRLTSTPRVAFNTEIRAGVSVLNPGDLVKCFAGGQTFIAEVQQLKPTTVVVKAGEKLHEITKEGVFKYEKPSEITQKSIKDELRAYYSQIYPADFVNKLLSL